LSIDVDGTLANSVKLVLRKLDREEGVRLSMGQVTRYNISKVSGVPKPRIKRMWEESWEDPREVPLISSRIPAVISGLKREFRIKILTGSIVDDQTIKRWLRLNEIHYDSFEKVSDWGMKPDRAGDIHIDDHFSVSEAFARSRKRMILLEQPWNRGRNGVWKGHEYIRVARNWPHIERILSAEA